MPSFRQAFRLIDYSVRDTRFILRLLVFLVSWQLLSTDYTSLAGLVGTEGPMVLPDCLRWSVFFERHGLQHGQVVTALPWLAVLALAVGGWRLRREWIWLGLFFICVLEWPAYRFRGQFYDLDMGTALLAIAAMVPLSWQGLRGPEKANPVASAIGRALAIYAATAYFLCGCSKLIFDPGWWRNVHLEYMLDALHLWNGVELPEPISTTALGISQGFHQWPWLSPVGALATLGLELFWFTALLGSRGRLSLLVPAGMLACHVVILLASGLNFMPFALSAFLVLAPWARPEGEALEPARSMASPTIAYLGVAGALAFLPALLANHYFPFANFNQFGWSYASTRTPQELYRIGYVDPRTGEVGLVPSTYGGFMDFRWVTFSGAAAQALVQAKTSEERRRHGAALERYIGALRPYESHRLWLGPLALPSHILTAGAGLDLPVVREFTVMRARSRPRLGGLEIEWAELARFRPGQSDWTQVLERGAE